MSAGISVGESEAREPVRIFCLIVLTFANAHNNVWEKKYKRKKTKKYILKKHHACPCLQLQFMLFLFATMSAIINDNNENVWKSASSMYLTAQPNEIYLQSLK